MEETPRAELDVETVPIESVHLDPANLRVHPAASVEGIKASLARFGQQVPIVVDADGVVVAGNGRLQAAHELGWTEIAIVRTGLKGIDRTAFAIADNRTSELSTWDEPALARMIVHLREEDAEAVQSIGFTAEEIEAFAKATEEAEPEVAKAEQHAAADAGVVEQGIEPAVSEAGDVWLLGDHVIGCLDSTDPETWSRLFEFEGIEPLAAAVHADPPYGMGKESDGVANDNLYREKLDDFHKLWIAAVLPHLAENGSLYVWGNPLDLWRFAIGAMREGEALEEFTFRNEIVWSKGAGFGQNSSEAHSFAISTERCLFLMRGQQFLGNMNAPDYWPGWEPLRVWLCEQRAVMGWTGDQVNEIVGKAPGSGLHWFAKSQFGPIPREAYDKLRDAANGAAFVETYDEVFGKLFPDLLADGEAHRARLSDVMRETRSFFDNVHDNMNEVWEFPRVLGSERFGHATPKPVAMIARALKSSVPADGIVIEPFLGTGSTLIAAEIEGRRCIGAELEPAYVDVVVRRWQAQTGEQARRRSSGATFDAIEASKRGES